MIYENLTDDECALYVLAMDESGLDLAEFCYIDEQKDEHGFSDGCFRAWPFQYGWWRLKDQKTISAGSRSCGKSLSIRFRAFAFPFINPGEEMVITAPEANHLDAVTGNIETLYTNCKFASEMLVGGRSGIKHRPFLMNFANGARIMGRIPQLDGSGVKGCLVEGEFILTKDGYKKAEDLSTDDFVMNHHNKWAKVSHIYEDVNDCYEVKGVAGFPIKVSCDHRFYGAVNASGPKEKRSFEPMIFCDVRNMVEDNFYWASPTHIPYVELPNVGPTDFFNQEEFWWVVGRYLADGFLSMDKANNKARKVNVYITPGQQEEFTPRLDALGLNYWIKTRKHSSTDILSIGNASIHNWLKEEFRELSDKQRIPAWVYGLDPVYRKNLLFGYLSGDGSYDEERERRTASTTSKELALGLQLLGQSLGMNTGASVVQPSVTETRGVKLKNKPKLSYRVTFNSNALGFLKDGYLLNKVQSVTPIGKRRVFNPVIEDGHSYLSGTVMSHNIHPIWLEQDEASDYGKAGWTELVSTVKFNTPRGRWRSHGVTRGIGDDFDDKITGKDPTWKVTLLPAMYRPDWTEKEKEDKIITFHGYESDGYRRNVLGLPGDGNSPMFVLHRIMANVTIDLEDPYNAVEYYPAFISEAQVREVDDITDLIEIPAVQVDKYKNFWIGMDFGWAIAPSAIVVFAEEKHPKKDQTSMKLLTKILLSKITPEDQLKVIMNLMNAYRPISYAMDATGAGEPVIALFKKKIAENPVDAWMVDRIKNFNFSSKVIVGFDDSIKINELDPNGWEAAAIRRPFLEASADAMRILIDSTRMPLPYDKEVIGELQSTPKNNRVALDAYGKTTSRKAGQHVLDAIRMAVLAQHTKHIDEFIESHKQNWTPPPMFFG